MGVASLHAPPRSATLRRGFARLATSDSSAARRHQQSLPTEARSAKVGLLLVPNRPQPVLGPDQEPVADDGGRRHGEVVEGIGALEFVLVAGLDDVGVALFAQREDAAVVRPE